jgi:hypothetical protein
MYALHLSRDLAYIVGVAPINSTVCNTFHQQATRAIRKLGLMVMVFYDSLCLSVVWCIAEDVESIP